MTGASILVALFVIVASEMLSGPGAHRKDEATAVDSGPPVRSYTMDLGDVSADQSALVPNPATAPASTNEPAPEAQPKLPEAPAPQPEAAPVQTQPAPQAAPAAVPAPPALAPAPQPVAAASAGGWWVQVGSFSQSANAEGVVRDLGAAGFSATVSSTRSKGRELFRVRAGPVADRAAADALNKRLAAAGHKGAVVAP